MKAAITVFRAQLVVPEQRQLFDYWTEKSGKRAMPSRKDINPAHIPRVLSGISLVDVSPEIIKPAPKKIKAKKPELMRLTRSPPMPARR